jgi:hypothetical protein
VCQGFPDVGGHLRRVFVAGQDLPHGGAVDADLGGQPDQGAGVVERLSFDQECAHQPLVHLPAEPLRLRHSKARSRC